MPWCCVARSVLAYLRVGSAMDGWVVSVACECGLRMWDSHGEPCDVVRTGRVEVDGLVVVWKGTSRENTWYTLAAVAMGPAEVISFQFPELWAIQVCVTGTPVWFKLSCQD